MTDDERARLDALARAESILQRVKYARLDLELEGGAEEPDLIRDLHWCAEQLLAALASRVPEPPREELLYACRESAGAVETTSSVVHMPSMSTEDRLSSVCGTRVDTDDSPSYSDLTTENDWFRARVEELSANCEDLRAQVGVPGPCALCDELREELDEARSTFTSFAEHHAAVELAWNADKAKLQAVLASRAPEPPQAQAWQPIETAPLDGRYLLLLKPSWYHPPPVTISRWKDIGGGRGGWDGYYGPEPTHWMPLPTAPSTAASPPPAGAQEPTLLGLPIAVSDKVPPGEIRLAKHEAPAGAAGLRELRNVHMLARRMMAYPNKAVQFARHIIRICEEAGVSPSSLFRDVLASSPSSEGGLREQERAVSEGRRKTLLAKSDELRDEWIRAEQAEAMVGGLRAALEHVRRAANELTGTADCRCGASCYQKAAAKIEAALASTPAAAFTKEHCPESLDGCHLWQRNVYQPLLTCARCNLTINAAAAPTREEPTP